MIDLHCHLLPGVDDGPSTLEEAIQLAKLAVKNGITHSIVTPHIHPGRYTNTEITIKEASNNFQKELVNQNIPLQIGFAGEVRLSDEILPWFSDELIPFYGKKNNNRIFLLEFPHNHIPLGSENLVKWLLDKNILPMIAHPERNKEIMRDMSKIQPFVQMGCLIQLTADSLVGKFGSTAQKCAINLLEIGCVTVLASDAHNLKYRPPRLNPGKEVVAKILGPEEAKKMVLDRPASLVSSQFQDLTNF